MSSNVGNQNYGTWVDPLSVQPNHTFSKSSGTYSDGFLWAWKRGESTWNIGFLHTYQITMFIGFIAAFLSVAYFWKRMKYSWDILQLLLIIIVPSSILGARLWFVISEGGWGNFWTFAGLSIQGGVMGACLTAIPFLYTKRHVVDVRTVLGIVLPAVIIGQAIGRFGNMDNHEVYGKIVSGSSLDWAVFKSNMLIDQGGAIAYRAPLFFYESMLNFTGYFVILWLIQRKNWVKPGAPAALYLMWYGMTRFIMEPQRDPVDIMRWGSMHVSTFFAGIWIVVGIATFIWWQGLTRPFDKWAEKIFSKKILGQIKKEYELITPIKPRRIMFIGEEVTYKKKYFLYFGEKVDNKVRLWIPKEVKWTKREINSGKKK